MTSHPNDMAEDLIRAHGELPALMPFLHLPVQSGSDRILAAMNRAPHAPRIICGWSRESARARPDIALSSDFIVGFPGETEEDFDATLGLAREVDFASTFFFKYSPRPGTPGADLVDQVAGRGQDRAARAPARRGRDAAAGLQRGRWSAGRSTCCSRSRAGTRARSPARSPYLQAGSGRWAGSLIGQRRPGRNRRMRLEFAVRPSR